MVRGHVHEEVLVESVEIRLELLRGHALSLGGVAWVVIDVGQKDGLGELGFNVFPGSGDRQDMYIKETDSRIGRKFCRECNGFHAIENLLYFDAWKISSP